MAWIESHQGLKDHPKTLNLANLMTWDIDQTIGKLHRFWWWCLDYAEDGDLQRYNDKTLASVVGVAPCDAREFVEAMVGCGGETALGFIDRLPYFRVHDWWDYAGMLLQIRYKHEPKKWQKVRALYNRKRCVDLLSSSDGKNKNGSLNGSKNSTPTNQPRPTNLNQPEEKKKNMRHKPAPVLAQGQKTSGKDPPEVTLTAPGLHQTSENAGGVAPLRKTRQDAKIEPSTPLWKELVSHLTCRWEKEKNAKMQFGGKEAKALQGLARLYEPEGVMALWDMWWIPEAPWADWAVRTGRSFGGFCAAIPKLLDDSSWRRRRETYRRQFGRDAQTVLKNLKSAGEVLQSVEMAVRKIDV